MDVPKCRIPGCTNRANNRPQLCKDHRMEKCRDCGKPLDIGRARKGNVWLCTPCTDKAHNQGELCEAG